MKESQYEISTLSTKVSLLPCSYAKDNENQSDTFTVFYFHGGNRNHIIFEFMSKTVREVIEESITTFKSYKGLKLSGDANAYELYAAKKSGKKMDYPAFQHTQNILLTNIKLYCLNIKVSKRFSPIIK